MDCDIKQQVRGAEAGRRQAGGTRGRRGAPGEEADEAVGLALSEAPAAASCIFLPCGVYARVREMRVGDCARISTASLPSSYLQPLMSIRVHAYPRTCLPCCPLPSVISPHATCVGIRRACGGGCCRLCSIGALVRRIERRHHLVEFRPVEGARAIQVVLLQQPQQQHAPTHGTRACDVRCTRRHAPTGSK